MTKIQFTLEAARRNAGYTQKEAAKALGVHYQTLASWEEDSSNLSFKDMNKIQALYHIPTTYLYFGPRNEFIRSLRAMEV